MKHTKLCMLISLLLALLLGGCNVMPSADTALLEEEKAAAVALAESYLLHITELESTLQAEREERYISESQYEKRIRELEAALEEISTSGGAPESGDSSELVFHYLVRDGGAVITGYEGNHPFVTIPATLDGYPVRVIGERAFENKSLAAVVLPEGLATIEWFAFYGCASLVDVSIPDSVREIGHAVFDGCPGVSLVCRKGSYAEEYAKSYGISYLSQ